MCVAEVFHNTHAHKNQQIGRMKRHTCSHTPTGTHTHTDIGRGTMGLPSLQAMVGVGGFPFFSRLSRGGA